jgi:hypothetical protein
METTWQDIRSRSAPSSRTPAFAAAALSLALGRREHHDLHLVNAVF